jgi:hypothetical protein
LNFTIKKDDELYDLNVDPSLLAEAEDFFQKMDKDMDSGYRMGPEFIGNLNHTQRAQIACSKLISALDSDNQPMVQLMIGYVLSRVPDCTGVILNDDGNPASNEVLT